MYQELIAKMNPCPKFNLQWYKNEDLYSDGEVEDFIIKIIAENRPEDYSNAVYEQFNWPIYYHLSPLRQWNSQENVQQQRFSGAVKKKILRLSLEI